jgi:MFS family permease
MISLTIRVILIGIETTIALWIPDIIINLIEIKRKSSLNLFGNILIIITPPLGSFITRIMGPFTIVGNKRKRNTVVLLIFFYILSVLISILIPENKSFSFVATIIVFLFCSATCLPMLQGISLSVINKKIKDKIFSFIHIFTLFFGTGLMPFIFGYVYQYNESNKILAVKYFLYANLGIGFLLLPILIYLVYRNDFRDNDRSSINSKGFSIENSRNGGEGIVEELGNAYGEELPDNIKKRKKTQLKSIDI